jgi:hypothetical protein
VVDYIVGKFYALPFHKEEVSGMFAELVKALDEKKTALERELAAFREEQALTQTGSGQSAGNAGENERRLALINEQSIKEYKALWQSFTPPGPFPCPFCYVFHKKISPLKPLPRLEDVEPVQCTVCGETFVIPVELLYA